jgi:hypothetical protein
MGWGDVYRSHTDLLDLVRVQNLASLLEQASFVFSFSFVRHDYFMFISGSTPIVLQCKWTGSIDGDRCGAQE